MTDDYDDQDDLPEAPHGPAISAEDYELLFLAAFAMGCEDVEVVDGENWLNLHFSDAPSMFNWNPLVHGDDALFLAVRLSMNIQIWRHDEGYTQVRGDGPIVEENHGDDRLAATRRAITRAAAEIGKQRSP